MSASLIRPLSAIAWELRAAWANGLRVSCSLERADLERVEGTVTRVAATGAFVDIGGLSVPLDRVLAVHKPSRLSDSSFNEGERWRGRGRRYEPQRERLWEPA